MWKIADLDPTKSYFLKLCEDGEGRRQMLLSSIPDEHPEVIGLETELVPYDLLRKRNLFMIAKAVKLKTGRSFTFDAHGIWFTQEEENSFLQNRGDLSKVPWVNGRIPRLAER
jgi:hypothetical protein